jgi:SAM-dependent methyltransferase
MKSCLIERLACPSCGKGLEVNEQVGEFHCTQCSYAGKLHAGIPLFIEIAGDIQPFEKQLRGPNYGSPWRQANWRFLETQVGALSQDEVILDVGAGHGDFADIYQGRSAILLDVYPYPEIDVVCDLTYSVPFRAGSIDAVVLMNVLEHIYDGRALFAAVDTLLKPGGVFVVAVPFLLKIHQAPYDYLRYTHFSLKRLGQDSGFDLLSLEGYYDPIFLLGESWRNIERTELRRMSRYRRAASRGLLWGIKSAASILEKWVGKGYVQPSDQAITPVPVGYHVVYRKKLNQGETKFS